MRTETETVRHGWLIVALLLIAALIAARWAVLHLPPQILEDAHRG
jgi:hypothetical protein